MEAQILTSSSNLAISSTSNYKQKAWHLASILLQLGRPVTPQELSRNCTIFQASPEIIEFICGIPNSPIYLTAKNFVSLSISAISAFSEYVSNSILKIENGVCGDGGERMFRIGEDLLRMHYRKRKKVVNEREMVAKRRATLSCADEIERENSGFDGVQRIASNNYCEVVDKQIDPSRPSVALSLGKFLKEVDSLNISDIFVNSTMVNSSIKLSQCPLNVEKDQESENKQKKCANNNQDICYTNRPCLDLPDLNEIAMLDDNQDGTILRGGMVNDGLFCLEFGQHDKNLSVESITPVTNAVNGFGQNQMHETKMEDMNEPPLMDNDGPPKRVDDILFGSWGKIFTSQDKLQQNNKVTSLSGTDTSKTEPTNQAELKKKQKTPSTLTKNNKLGNNERERKGKKHRIDIAMMDKAKSVARKSAFIQERCDNGHESSKDQPKTKFPTFESYTIEEEEGSGGYGIVYRARRKIDGLTFAIKCPHLNAKTHHVKNELKMLERFGGKSFVIKYEGSLKNGSSDCFILEHVEHDRPDVLKREIDISQLQWYGYCLFKALVSLHKQGVFHRDIKPGNFLYSRKTHKGFLIDFNLAKDMNQKHVNSDKSKSTNVTTIQHITSKTKLWPAQESKTMKKPMNKLKAHIDLGHGNSLTSQGADVSGLTSTKTPSVERLREPLPSKGRKALINLAQEAMQSPNHRAVKLPTSNRKRVVASPSMTGKKLIYLTPTPLHSSGMAIAGGGSLKNREVKANEDGPCVGTKGFRAPEVLLRSFYQGPKIDVWSSGVTLLYLISGRMPFGGDPEQNMKEIVKLKGNEELWEVAKLHNLESSFPEELLDIQFLPSMTIRDWYLRHTKRSDLLEVIPSSLFDLLEKCLTVNPRLRITAEEALSHEFFAQCHEAIRKKRLSNMKNG